MRSPGCLLVLSAVWACARLLADAVSTLPLDVYRRGDRDPLPELPPLLRTPAAGMSLNEWLYAVMVSLLLRGNAYGIVTGRSGSTLLPAQVDLAHPDRLGVTVLPDGRVQHRLDGKELDPADVWHVRAYAFPGTEAPGRMGRRPQGQPAPGRAARRPVRGADRQARGVPVPRHHRRQRQCRGPHLRRAPGDDRRHHRWAAGLHQPRDAEPGSADLHGAGLAGPVGERHLGAAPSTQYCRFNAAGMVRVDLKSRYEAHEIAIRAGFLTVNEVRALEDRGPLPEGGTAVA